MSSGTTADQLTGPVGFSLPLSPSGTSAMLTAPPWHFSGEIVLVDYRVDPAAARRFLPPELDLGPDPGAAAAVFAEWQWCSESGAELTDPEQCQFGEFLILLGCEYRGRPLARCPYAWVDRPVPMMRGWVQGMPKQLGEIHLSRPVRVGRAGSRPDGPGRRDGTVSVRGKRIAELGVRLTGQAEPPFLHTVPLVHTRVFPAWLPGERTVSRLVTSKVADVEFGPVWTGDGELALFDALDGDYASLAPVETGAGYAFAYAESLCHGTELS